MKKETTIDLNEKMKELIEMAEGAGVEQNFFFVSTFKRYQVQLKILNQLEDAINKDSVLVTKEYVKGRKNIYTHPAIADYNRTATAANQTVQTILKIITTLAEHSLEDSAKKEDDTLW